MKFRVNSIKSKLILYLLLGFVPIFLLLTYLGGRYTRVALYKEALTKAKVLALKAARDIELFSSRISRKPHEVAILAGQNLAPLNRIEELMKQWVESSSTIYGMALAYLPQYSPNKGPFCTYYYESSGKVRHKSLVPPGYDYTKFQWFYQPLEERRSMWSEPYFDKGGGGIWMSTYSVPVINPQGEVIGIATADVSLTYLSQVVNSIRFLKEGRAFLLSSQGNFLAHPQGKDVPPVVYKLIQHHRDPLLKPLFDSMTTGESGYKEISLEGKQYLVYYTPVRTTNWSIGVIFPKDRLFKPLQQLRIYSAGVGVAGISFIVLLVLWISNSVTRDVVKIKEVSMEIAQGKFDVPIPPNLGEEAREIAKALETMQKSLKEYVARSQKTAVLENELELAAKIQSSFVPTKFHLLLQDLEIAAQTKAARQVGGDFYGVKKLGPSHTLVYLGDVSGKGVPAALYVAVVRSMMEVLATPSSPVAIITPLNRYLARLTRKNNFATLFLAIFDTSRGTVSYCNAGHLPPLIQIGDTVASLTTTGDVPLGLFPDYQFKERSLDIGDFNSMLIFSDGIIESKNPRGEFFGGERLVKAFQKLSSLDAESIVENLLSAQDSFIGNQELYDDTTIICVKRITPPRC